MKRRHDINSSENDLERVTVGNLSEIRERVIAHVFSTLRPQRAGAVAPSLVQESPSSISRLDGVLGGLNRKRRHAATNPISQAGSPTQAGLKNLSTRFPQFVPHRVKFGFSVPPSLPAPNDKIFDADLFNLFVKTHLHYVADSYSYAIAVDNVLVYAGAEGHERIQPDLKPNEKKTPIDPVTTRLDIASMSKTVTAVAVIRLLLEKKINIDNSILPYLPPESWGWKLHDDMKSITFRKLLTHTSGVSSGAWSMSGVRARLALEADIAPNTYDYANFNYALLRILSYKILGGNYLGPAPPDSKLATQHGAAFCEYIRTTVLAPSGTVDATWGPAKGQGRALAYPWPLDYSTPGAQWSPNNGEIYAGPSALHLSSVEMIYFLTNIKNLISQEWLSFMIEGLAGVDTTSNSDYGKIYGHGGFLVYTSGGNEFSSQSRWAAFSNNSTYVTTTATSCANINFITSDWKVFYNLSWS